MRKFFNICSQHQTAEAVIADCMHQLERAPVDANFGFIYATDEMSSEFKTLLLACKDKTGIQHWVGSLGTGVISSGIEHYDRPAASIMLAEFDVNEFAMLPLIRKSSEIDSQLLYPREFATSFGVIHGDPFYAETQNLLHVLQKKLDNGFIVGGLTSSRDLQLQVADEVCSGGISGVVFSENIGVLTNLSQGCSPIGAKHRITRSQENVVFTLDQKPALDVMMQDVGVSTHDALKKQNADIFIGLCIPGSDLSDYTVRNLVGVDFEHNVFAINDYISDGNEMIFCRRDKTTAEADMRLMLENLAKRLEPPPKGGIYVSCLGRGREQFGNDSEEVRMIHEKLGDFPLTGFFANGEIHHDKLYGYTGVLTLFV